MDWQVKPLAKCSALSGTDFVVGDSVRCVLYRDDSGTLQRVDLRLEEAKAFAVAGVEVGRWLRKVKTKNNTKKQAQRELLDSAEELFLSLVAMQAEGLSKDQQAFKQILALFLERKRVLRPLKKPSQMRQCYLHVKSKQRYTVLLTTLSVEDLASMYASLSCLLG